MLLSLSLMFACMLLTFAVLVQNSKGKLQHQAIKNVVGTKNATPFIEKATYTLAFAVVLLSFLSHQ